MRIVGLYPNGNIGIDVLPGKWYKLDVNFQTYAFSPPFGP